ncbi:MAG: hypothetical protein JW990_00145, partial [Thermoleophilia bacterium]|nr:hypothetical protein [Thermoleophilia bacterium]
MDTARATKIADQLRDVYPDAQAVDTGGGFVNVYWTQDLEGELRSFVLGDDNGPLGESGGWSV